MDPSEQRILIIEDEKEIADFVSRYLKKEGFNVEIKYRGDDGFASIITNPPDLAVIDIMLPGMDGLEVLRRTRERFYLPAILLTSKAEEMDRIIGLEVGADDYVTKPFSPRELVARIKALLRRVEAIRENRDKPPEIQEDNITLDGEKRRLVVGKQELQLTAVEFSLAKVLMSKKGRVFTREELLDIIWGQDFTGESRTVDVHIKNLRKKIRDAGGPPEIIRSVRGVGYTCE
ncbi:MAG: response regulator transcription factor [Firmicutes bacterium]|nr:response regulator transcription factor [Bacillota bacterium]